MASENEQAHPLTERALKEAVVAKANAVKIAIPDRETLINFIADISRLGGLTESGITITNGKGDSYSVMFDGFSKIAPGTVIEKALRYDRRKDVSFRYDPVKRTYSVQCHFVKHGESAHYEPNFRPKSTHKINKLVPGIDADPTVIKDMTTVWEVLNTASDETPKVSMKVDDSNDVAVHVMYHPVSECSMAMIMYLYKAAPSISTTQMKNTQLEKPVADMIMRSSVPGFSVSFRRAEPLKKRPAPSDGYESDGDNLDSGAPPAKKRKVGFSE